MLSFGNFTRESISASTLSSCMTFVKVLKNMLGNRSHIGSSRLPILEPSPCSTFMAQIVLGVPVVESGILSNVPGARFLSRRD